MCAETCANLPKLRDLRTRVCNNLAKTCGNFKKAMIIYGAKTCQNLGILGQFGHNLGFRLICEMKYDFKGSKCLCEKYAYFPAQRNSCMYG